LEKELELLKAESKIFKENYEIALKSIYSNENGEEYLLEDEKYPSVNL
jgi:hypothetical protein